VLGAAYAATIAPGVTLWDAGELIAAVHTFGIPHEPGTPLYILLARAWSLAIPFAGTALATNLFSAFCTAAAGGALAFLLARATGSRAMALGSALCAGGMFTVWSSATETEVYAAVLLLVMLTLLAADQAGRTRGARWRVATAYAIALAVPLHLAALVAAPAAILLAVARDDESIDWRSGGPLAAALVLAAGVGLASAPLVLAGAVGFVVAAATVPRARREALATFACALLAISAIAMLPLRAHFDPWLNEGAPMGLGALWDAIGRRQYATAGLWPRNAPFWVQLANWFEYADWQVALGLSNGVAPSWWRTPITLLFALLGVIGSRAHWRLHRRSWRAFALLFLSASLGLVVYLNFKAGASFGWGVLSPTAAHEVRDRDYFFVLGFWVWGAWAGMGAVWLAQAAGARWVPVGVLAAAAPLVLNAPAADRRVEPERSVARAVGLALVGSAPPNAVLFTGGDNDSFPAWYAQAVEGVRPDVTVVVAPLLGTRWYRAQLARRDSLVAAVDVDVPRSTTSLVAAVAARARANGRPVAVARMAGNAVRLAAGAPRVARGLVYVARAQTDGAHVLGGDAPDVDTAGTAALLRALPFPPSATTMDGIDPAPASVAAYFRCPGQYLAAARGEMPSASLDSICKLR
jgi:hypothetical protein